MVHTRNMKAALTSLCRVNKLFYLAHTRVDQSSLSSPDDFLLLGIVDTVVRGLGKLPAYYQFLSSLCVLNMSCIDDKK